MMVNTIVHRLQLLTNIQLRVKCFCLSKGSLTKKTFLSEHERKQVYRASESLTTLHSTKTIIFLFQIWSNRFPQFIHFTQHIESGNPVSKQCKIEEINNSEII